MRRREIGLLDLLLFNLVAVLGVQWIAVSAHVGPSSIPLHLSLALLFLAPTAYIVASLSRRFAGAGGFYVWIKAAFGETHGFLCGWCWWISVLLYLPSLLLAGVGMAAYIAGSDGVALASNPSVAISATLVILWIVIGTNILGLRVAKWIGNAGALLMYAGGALVCVASLAVAAAYGPATRFTFDALRLDFDRLSFWGQIALAYTGLELGSLLGGDVRNPESTIPKAVWLGSLVIFAAYTLGAVSLMLVLPPERIQPMTGLIDVAMAAGSRLGMDWLGAVAALLLFTGIVGKFSAWTAASARMPFLIGIDGSFPEAFSRLHPRWSSPYVALAFQGFVCSALLVVAQAGETVSAGWHVLTDMAILTGFLPFLYIFIAAWKFGLRASAASGLAVTLIALGLSLVPPEGAASPVLFYLKIVGGCGLLLAGGWAARTYSQRHGSRITRFAA
jgi:amino acid transporter